MSKIKSIHTSRTIMFSELEKVMDYSSETNNYFESLNHNITGKKSNTNALKTAGHLKTLYQFDINYPAFNAFNYFWQNAETIEKPMLAFLYAFTHDSLLNESLEVVKSVPLGVKAEIEKFDENIEKYHPSKYTPNTKRSVAQNIASSWKQAGFIEGKVKNIRVKPTINFRVACFAFLLAYLSGDRGDFIWNSTVVKSLCLNESQLRDLAIDCAKRDLMRYQFAGGVTSISFSNLLTKIGIDAV